MAHRVELKTTYEVEKVIDPIYSGGGVALSQDGRILATTLGEDVVLSNLETGAKLARIEGDGEAVTSIALTLQCSHLIVASRSMSMRIYSLEETEDRIATSLNRTVKPHSSPVVTLAVDRTGTLVATGGADGIIKVWDIRGGYTTHTLHGHSGVVSAFSFFEVSMTNALEDGGQSDGKKRKRGINSDHNSKTSDLDDSDRGYRLASGSEDGQIRIWNLHKRKCAAVLESHLSVVRSLEYQSTTNILLSASRDKTVNLWNANTWKLRNTIPILETVETAGFLREGSLLYTGGENGRLRIWSAKTGKELTEDQSVQSEEKSIVQALQNSARSFVMTIHADQTLILHSTLPLAQADLPETIPPLPILRQISGTHDDVIDIAFVGRDRSLLAVATNLEDLRLLSIRNPEGIDAREGRDYPDQYFGADVGLLKGHNDIIICLDVDWSGHWLATGAKDNIARLWRIDPSEQSFTCYGVFTGHAESLGAIALCHATPDPGSAAYKDPLNHPPPFLVTGSQDKTVKRWDIASLEAQSRKASRATYTRKAHDKDINAMDTDYTSRLFASASQDRTVKIWSLEDGEAVGILRGHKRGVWSVRFAPKGAPAVTTENGGSQTSSARGLVVTGSGDKTVKIWNLADYACIRTFEGHTNSVLKVLWMPMQSNDAETNGNKHSSPFQVASAAGDGLVKLWNVQSGELACTLDNHTDRVWSLASDASTGTLVSGGGDSVISFWKDTTQSTASTASKEATERVEQDQALQNYIRSGSYRKAIVLALQLNHPARLLGLFKEVCAKWPKEEGSLIGVKDVDTVLQTLSDDQMMALLKRVRDWNANAKTAPIAQQVLRTLVKSYPPAKFVRLGERRTNGKQDAGIKEILDALRAYTERHYRRMEELIDESYLVEYLLREMDEI